MSNEVFNKKFIFPLTNLTEEIGSPNKAFFTVLPQSISRFYFFDTNNTKAVLISLICWMDEEGKTEVFRSVLAENSGIKVRTTDKILKELVSKGFITKKRNVHDNKNEANTYQFKDLRKNPYLLVSEAIHTMKQGIRHKQLKQSIDEFVNQAQTDESLLIKRIEKETEKNVYNAFRIACEAVIEHFKNDLGIKKLPPKKLIKKEKPASNKAGKKYTNTYAIPRNREWTGKLNSEKPSKIYL